MIKRPTASAVVAKLVEATGADRVIHDADVMRAYASDQASWVSAGSPLAVVLPRSAAEVANVVLIAAEHGVPVVPRGAGSGLSGGANAVDGCIVVCLSAMRDILEVDVANELAVVQPGVLNGDLKRRVADSGLWYPPDPASFEFSTIGGNVATNAGGLCCVKYGVTGDYVLALEVVLADGSIVRTGRRTLKGVAGYDLTRLFAGSEGTLGIVTEVTLRLRPPPPAPATMVAAFASTGAAGQAVVAVASDHSRPSLLELMDATTIRAVERWKRMDLDCEAAALLLAQSDRGDIAGHEDVQRYAAACTEAGATYVAVTADRDEGDMLLAARRLAYPALERQGATLLDDVAVPRSAIPDLLNAVARISSEHEVLIGTFGHAGDGNLHPTIVFDGADGESTRRARAAFDAIVGAALELGGTITGEHGVGSLKAEWLSRELGGGGMALHAAVKRALDPDGILNPGKVLLSAERL
ncbi:MAG TPA: FAD-linked oxidase C-terminal domain-containing protein [Acidimicrobiales bacterium]|nr:FAD-linked oxidase C-terminal domain-containing protein [Acidimicrobiales bacterium]